MKHLFIFVSVAACGGSNPGDGNHGGGSGGGGGLASVDLASVGGAAEADLAGFDAGAAPSHFSTLPAGATLPSEAACAAWVRRTGFEPRPQNASFNRTVPTAAELATVHAGSWSGYDPKADAIMRQRVTGNFTGTTDELLQWAACKWGFDEDVVRAQAETESSWWQDGGVIGEGLGDPTTDASLCPPGGTHDSAGNCFQSYGLVQVKWVYAKEAWPMTRDSSPFNLDYMYAWRRACFEGYITWFGNVSPPYQPGDLWGCVGQWFSGGWYDAGAQRYIATVKQHLQDRDWLKPGF